MNGQKGYVLVQAVRGGRILSLATFWRTLRRWRQLARERRQLAGLDDAALKDLGLSRGEAWQEAERPFWDDPLRRE